MMYTGSFSGKLPTLGLNDNRLCPHPKTFLLQRNAMGPEMPHSANVLWAFPEPGEDT